MEIIISDHARKSMNNLHVDPKRLRDILEDPEHDYPDDGHRRTAADNRGRGTPRRIAQKGEFGVVYTRSNGAVIVVTVLKRKENWFRRRRP